MTLSGKHVFIIEDNTLDRVIYQIALTRAGAWVEFDRWGRNTLAEMEKNEPIDLIILDLMLPGGASGYDVFAQLRNSLQFKAVPIVAVSAADPSFAVPKTRELGFAGFIAKPIDDGLLLDQLTQIIHGTPVWYAGERYQNAG